MRRGVGVMRTLVALTLLTGSAWADVLHFEDLYPGYQGLGPMVSPYHGFSLPGTAPYWVTKDLVVPSGYHNTIDGNVGIFTPAAQPIAFFRAQPFDVGTVRIGAAWNDDQYVTIEGWLGATLVGQVYAVVGYDGETLTLNFEGIDTLKIIPNTYTGTDHDPSDGGTGPIVVLDDINVETAQPPVADAGPDQTVEQASTAGTLVTLDGGASTGTPPLSFAWYEGAALLGTGPVVTQMLQLGVHTITLVVTDPQGQSDSDECVVTVQDTTPPTLDLTILKPTLWPVNHLLVLAAVSSASDICDPDPRVDIEVTSNETISGPGSVNPDWEPMQDGDVWQVRLRAERTGAGGGRTYTIAATATDASGNATVATGTVTVPHDQRRR